MADCLFCAIARGADPASIVYETETAVAFLDHRPVFKGHTLLVPRRHVVTLAELPDELLVPLFSAVRSLSAAIPAACGAQGSFVGINNVVSQSVPHLHVHIVPRTKGDGLRGFFWPRTRYAGPEEMADYAARIRTALV